VLIFDVEFLQFPAHHLTFRAPCDVIEGHHARKG
jgi:hypothetical protein